MHLINERTLIRDIAKVWKAQYRSATPEGRDSDSKIYAQLLELDKEQATAENVAEIIGNTSWTLVPACYECYNPANEVVALQGSEYSEYYCKQCLEKSLSLFKEPS